MSWWRLGDFAPSKGRGQNFLVDPGFARRMIEALEPAPSDVVLEIGPGTGSLTRLLVERVGRVVAVEKDRALAAFLREEFAGESRLTLVEGDVLTVDPAALALGPSPKLVGNLPYALTTPILLRIVEWPGRFGTVVVTVQREVADRMVAGPGSRTYGRLSVLLALFGTLEVLFHIPAGAFRPRPRVRSSVVRIRPHGTGQPAIPYRHSRLEKVVAAAFGSRRKRLANALSKGLATDRSRVEAVLADLGIDRGARAESLPPDRFVELARLLPADGGGGDGRT